MCRIHIQISSTNSNETRTQISSNNGQGMNLVCPYVSTSAPDDVWFENMQKFMDRAHDTGFKIHFQLIAFEKLGNDNETLANLTKIINTFKDHPALFSWYLADEPDGQNIPLSLLQPKYDMIKSLDPHHDVSMVFCGGGELNYLSAYDIVMVDPYPVPNSPVAPTIMASMELSRLANKSIILVPQSFGGGEGWARTPTAVEERLMTYLGLIHGATGIQYFVRNPPNAFPYAASAWNEIRQISMEVFELTPALLNRRLNEYNRTSENDAVQIGVWLDRDESMIILAANQNDTTVSFDLKLNLGTNYQSIAILPFENFFNINLTNGNTLHDTLRPFGTSVYRIEKVHDTADDVTNLVYNGGYEITGNPGVPDGAYVSMCDVDAASTFFAVGSFQTCFLHMHDNHKLKTLSHTGSPSLQGWTTLTRSSITIFQLRCGFLALPIECLIEHNIKISIQCVGSW